jgi:hypothetical protein
MREKRLGKQKSLPPPDADRDTETVETATPAATPGA